MKKTVIVWLLAGLMVIVSAGTALADQIFMPIVYKPASTPTEPPPPTEPPATGVFILPNHTYFVDNIDYLHVIGEVWNNTNFDLTLVRISANFFNSSGQLLDTDFTYTYMDTLPAGDKTCFNIFVPVPPGWSYYEFEAPHYWTDGEQLPNLAVINDSGSYNSTFGWYEILGQVRNDSGARADFVSPVGTLYNADNKVIGCDFTYVNSTDLEPGQISSFEMTFSGRDYLDASTYRLQVDGNPVP